MLYRVMNNTSKVNRMLIDPRATFESFYLYSELLVIQSFNVWKICHVIFSKLASCRLRAGRHCFNLFHGLKLDIVQHLIFRISLAQILLSN